MNRINMNALSKESGKLFEVEMTPGVCVIFLYSVAAYYLVKRYVSHSPSRPTSSMVVTSVRQGIENIHVADASKVDALAKGLLPRADSSSPVFDDSSLPESKSENVSGSQTANLDRIHLAIDRIEDVNTLDQAAVMILDYYDGVQEVDENLLKELKTFTAVHVYPFYFKGKIERDSDSYNNIRKCLLLIEKPLKGNLIFPTQEKVKRRALCKFFKIGV